MKTRCPDCQTTFRVTPEQLKARAGKVRCGQCRSVFNALDSLLDETSSSIAPAPRITSPRVLPETSALAQNQPSSTPASPPAESVHDADTLPEGSVTADEIELAMAITPAETPVPDAPPLSEHAAQELGKASGLILPRDTTEIPGYSKWAEGVMAGSPALPVEKAARWPFVLAAALLALALAGQIVFRFRSEIATTTPSLRPLLELLSEALDAEVPLPRHVELVSIETSDLQTDPARGNLLILNATLRNRANYGQAFPSLELSLTDTQDVAIARRVFPPEEYLSPSVAADQPFAANSDVTVRLWMEASDIGATGYRLYVFYP
ncbi:MAG: zinc-ribbon domain-containing protein [Propionivibrio sp.]|uniref:Zinc-ribbon domain-containing protein n=1 Tax=Candidatus Propionivibrio dominans TaxID=2954373 RepID=A0A9D7FAB5_9RHOO|nr:zinc-ribbon domain-containing protein [Candidatus Propionivibrio dominans]